MNRRNRTPNPATTREVFDTLQRVVTVHVKLGDTNIARAGRGADAKTASCTCDFIGSAQGSSAAVAAAAKYFGCEKREVMLLLVQTGNSITGERAIFDARCTTKLATPITITPAAKPLRKRSVKNGGVR
jgi:hypothetical protein